MKWDYWLSLCRAAPPLKRISIVIEQHFLKRYVYFQMLKLIYST